ncbi:hypothetical protein HPDFL43_05690 [Hoeflea phototrophica DFL-43]|jgi:hypothetical protein|uniref:Uncharacterized protein n=1 Tax=Hoeflea phototrophica (strain DSM 17068 / NCIMB 14078 / DFL-43) TaxID=411684 RepID=A9D4N8_HOEPD|nr:hypothetical protein [Hoeflea phototrophica]EDQ33921.1 hypothetical protein HPDFL43_05690 [Hoeflea phototrophica DFL-43]
MIQYQAQPPAAPSAPTASCREALTGRMADQMREMAFAGETVSPETLIQRGWTAETVERLSPAAIAQARRQSVRRVER